MKKKIINVFILFLKMIGLTDPTSGAAFVEGSDIRFQMNEIYTSMGVCPQHEYVIDLLSKFDVYISLSSF